MNDFIFFLFAYDLHFCLFLHQNNTKKATQCVKTLSR